jgi:hypothetical protein
MIGYADVYVLSCEQVILKVVEVDESDKLKGSRLSPEEFKYLVCRHVKDYKGD